MKKLVQQIQQLNGVTPLQQQIKTPAVETDKPDVSFSTLLKNAIEEVNQTENAASVKTEMLAQGKIENLHDVMLSAQKASITVETAVQVQQKVIDIYNEMMRMQV